MPEENIIHTSKLGILGGAKVSGSFGLNPLQSNPLKTCLPEKDISRAGSFAFLRASLAEGLAEGLVGGGAETVLFPL